MAKLTPVQERRRKLVSTEMRYLTSQVRKARMGWGDGNPKDGAIETARYYLHGLSDSVGFSLRLLDEMLQEDWRERVDRENHAKTLGDGVGGI